MIAGEVAYALLRTKEWRRRGGEASAAHSRQLKQNMQKQNQCESVVVGSRMPRALTESMVS